MERREFLKYLAAGTATLSIAQLETLLAAVGFHQEGPYNGPLLTSYVSTTCGGCVGGCGLRVRKVDDIPVKIDGNPIHPVNRGGICPVGVSALALLVHPHRVKQPMLRTGPRGSGEFALISWDEAERLIREKLSELRQAGRPEQFLYVDGREKGPGLDLARKFTYDFGSPNFYHQFDPSLPVAAAIWGGDGTSVGYDLENSRLILCFGYPVFESGNNPVYYAGLRSRLLSQPEGSRGSFVIIDPRLSASAAKAEQWVPIKQGTYGLLALGMIYVIIKEQLYDNDAVRRYCVGFEDSTDRRGNNIEGFKSYVLKNYYPSLVSERTGVPVDQVIGLARMFASTPKSVAIVGDNVRWTVDGILQSWAIMALNAITGRIGSSGGVVAVKPYPFKKLTAEKVKAKPIAAANETFPYLSGSGLIESLPGKILAAAPYSIKVAMFNGINPVYHSPQSNRFRQALQNIPFSIVMTAVHDEMSTLADLVLPDCSFLEKHDLVIPISDFVHPVVSLMQPVIKPLYNSRQSDEVVIGLGRKLLGETWQRWINYSSYLEDRLKEIFETNAGTLFSDQFKVSFESLLAERGWRRQEYKDLPDFIRRVKEIGGWWDPLRLPQSEHSRYPTMSQKFFLVSKPLQNRFRRSQHTLAGLLKKAGLTLNGSSPYMLGTYLKSSEKMDQQFPLDLYLIELTTFRGHGSQLKAMADMVGYYQDVKWRSWVELNPETAKKLGLTNKQMVWVESVRGKQRLMVLYNPGLVPHVAAIPVGFGQLNGYGQGENINTIIAPKRELFTGMAAQMETKVRIHA